MRLTSSNHWKFLAVLFPIIGTLALAQPQPGGLGGFFQAWYGASIGLPSDYLHFWNLSANLNANDDAGNMDGATTGGSYTTNGFVQASGAISHITFGGPITNSTTAYTLSMWAKPDTLAMADNANGGWLLNDREASSNLDFQLAYRKDLSPIRWQWVAWNDGGAAYVAAFTNVQNDTWYHLVCIADGIGGEVALYVNGELADSVAFSGTLANSSTGAARTGNNAWSTPISAQQFEGIQDKIRFYNRRLSENEITAIYNFEKEEKGIP